jgi:hypothetical protein
MRLSAHVDLLLLETLAMFVYAFVLEITRMHLDQDNSGTYFSIAVALTTYTNLTMLRLQQASFANPAITIAVLFAGW